MRSYYNPRKGIDIYRLLFVVLTFSLFFFPTKYSGVRFLLLVGTTIAGMYSVSWRIRGEGIKVVLLFIALNFFSLIVGIVNGAGISAFRYQTVDFLWPIMFFMAVQPLKEEDDWGFMIRVLVFCELVVSIFDVIFLAGSFLGIRYEGIINYVQQFQGYMYGDLGHFFQYFSNCQVSHIFMFPFLLVLNIVEQSFVKKSILRLTTLLAVICYLFSGRVAFILSATISFLTCIAIKKYLDGKKKISMRKAIKRVLGIIVVAVIVIVIMRTISLEISSIWRYIKYKFSQDSTDSVRYYQNLSLLNGWKESPLIGHGTGIFSQDMGGYIWSKRDYESTYHVILFRKGLIGLFNYLHLFGWIILTLIKKCKRKMICNAYALPMIAGFVSILVASYADPYLFTMGSMWMIFYPFAIANNASMQGKGLQNDREE